LRQRISARSGIPLYQDRVTELVSAVLARGEFITNAAKRRIIREGTQQLEMAAAGRQIQKRPTRRLCRGRAALGERMARLAEARTREGYMAESRADGEGYVLVENHCPICVAAKTCQGFCRAELDTFRAVLGHDATVERTEHIIQGDRRCAYRVSPKNRPQEGPRRRDVRRPRRG
jgi:predicted ArsR family transcriptional regulator